MIHTDRCNEKTKNVNVKVLCYIVMSLLLCLDGMNCLASEVSSSESFKSDDSITVEATVILSGPQPTTLPAGDNKNHVVGIGKRQGKAFFADGRKADYSNVYFVDLFPGKIVDVWGYTKMVFQEGSWIFIKFKSNFTGLDQSGEPIFEGTGEILEGTGQYQGISGSVRYKNWRIPPDKDHPHGARKSNAIFTYLLP